MSLLATKQHGWNTAPGTPPGGGILLLYTKRSRLLSFLLWYSKCVIHFDSWRATTVLHFARDCCCCERLQQPPHNQPHKIVHARTV